MAAALVLVLGLVAAIVPAVPAARAHAAGSLTVDPGRLISSLGEWSPMTISGEDVDLLYSGADLVVLIEGPAAPEQVGRSDVRLPVATSWRINASTVGPPSPSTAAEGGTFTFAVPPAARTLTVPGAYRVTASVVGGGAVASSGVAWIGKVAPRQSQLDLAFVWPAALGIHRDPDGVFFDGVLEEAVVPDDHPGQIATTSGGRLGALLGLHDRFPGWRFTVAVEPVLLAQLRDMAGGYRRLGAGGAAEEVPADSEPAQNAAAALAALAALEPTGAVGLAVMPFATPDLAVLAREGWRDGFEQLQLGKQEVRQTLGLALPPVGAYSPGLGLTAGSIRYYGEASIDHVVVDGSMAGTLSQPPPAGTVAVRARDDQNDRVTLVLADSEIRELVGPPWDAGVFFAGLAARLATSSPAALVVTLAAEYVIPPQQYLDAIGKELAAEPWIATTTLAGLLRSHPPDSRPVVFTGDAVEELGYIGDIILAEVRTAHALVADLGAIADAMRTPLETSRRLLYSAQSRWWYRPDVSPEEAGTGLAYAVKAGATAQGELDKIAIDGMGPSLVWGDEGSVSLTIENGAAYPMQVGLELSGDGIEFASDPGLMASLQPGLNEFEVEVKGTGSSPTLQARLLAGTTVLAEKALTIRFVTFTGLVPWLVLGALVVGGTVETVLILRRRRGRARA
jgi:hypothetical protein